MARLQMTESNSVSPHTPTFADWYIRTHRAVALASTSVPNTAAAQMSREDVMRTPPLFQCGIGGLMGLYAYRMWCPGNGVRLDRLPFEK